MYARQLLESSINRLVLASGGRDKTARYRLTELRNGNENPGTVIFRVDEESVVEGNKISNSKGISLYTLMQWGVTNSFKRKMFHMMMEFPVWHLQQQRLENAAAAVVDKNKNR